MTTPKDAKPAMSADRKKQLALGGLLGLLLIVVAWNTIGGSSKPAPPAPKPTDGRVRNADLRAGAARDAGAAPADGITAKPRELAETFGPLEVLPVLGVFSGDLSPSRNVFDFPPPPKVPPPPAIAEEQPPPPTINIGNISPGSGIAGTSKPVTVTVTGRYFPPDAVVTVNNNRVQTQRQSDSVLRITLGARDMANAGSVRIKVVSASQPDRLWSRELPFTLQPSPEPTESFIYSGRIGNQAVIGFKDGKRPKVVSVGDSLNGAVLWKIVAINERQVEMLDTRNEIRKTITLTPKSTS